MSRTQDTTSTRAWSGRSKCRNVGLALVVVSLVACARPSTDDDATEATTAAASTQQQPSDQETVALPTQAQATTAGSESSGAGTPAASDPGFDYTNLAGTTDGNIGGGDVFECEFREGYAGPTPYVGKEDGYNDFAPGSVRNICLIGFTEGADGPVDVLVALTDPGGTTVEEVVTVSDTFGFVEWVLSPDVSVGTWTVAATTLEAPDASGEDLPADSPAPAAPTAATPTPTATDAEAVTPASSGPATVSASSTLAVVTPTAPSIRLVPGGGDTRTFLVNGWPQGAEVAFGLYSYPQGGGFDEDGGWPAFALHSQVATVTFDDRRAAEVVVETAALPSGFYYCLNAPGVEYPCGGLPFDMFVH